MASNYQYEPLSRGKIRLMMLLKGRASDDLQCRIRHVQVPGSTKQSTNILSSLKRFSDLKYEALSYVWGAPATTETILCEGMVMRITANLATALRHLRRPEKSRTLWVDQICINQMSQEEQSRQVSIMGDIYRNAEQVISWLGEDLSGHGHTVLRFIEEMLDGKFKDLGPNQVPEDSCLIEHGLPVQSAPEWKALNEMIAVPYFTRVWMLQEVLLARRVIVKWGDMQLPFEYLVAWVNWSFKNPSLHNFSGLLINQTNLIRLLSFTYLSKGRKFEDVILKVTSRDSTKMVDRIYAILGLVDDGPDIWPDYTKPEQEVFRDVTLQLINLRQNLDLLANISYWNEGTLTPEVWPTWVPQWNRSNEVRIGGWNRKFRVGNSIPFTPPILSNNISCLELRGLHMNHITRVSTAIFDPLQDSPSVESHIRQVWDAWNIVMGDGSVKKQKYLIQAFLWTLLCGLPDEDNEQMRSWSQRQIYQDFATWWANNLFMHVLNGEPDPRGFVSNRIILADIAALKYRISPENPFRLDHSMDKARHREWKQKIDNDPNSSIHRDVEEAKTIMCQKMRPSYDELTARRVTEEVAYFYHGGDHQNFRREWVDSGIARKFFTLKGGYMGTGPRIMKETDVIALLFGGSVPYVLRPFTDGYMFIGECYIHGIMNGEYVEELRESGKLEERTKTFRLY